MKGNVKFLDVMDGTAALAKYVPSRFNVRSRTKKGSLVLYNSYTGAVVTIPNQQEEIVLQAIHPKIGFEGEPTPFIQNLIDGGFLVPAGTDELRRAQRLHQYETHKSQALHLIIMPTENCNFRCVYCYESFERDKMELDVREGLKNFIRQKCSQIRFLNIHWFGGEPLFAADVVEELSQSFMESCAKYGVRYSAAMTTNGFLLDEAMFNRMAAAGVNRYQITLDGTAHTHNQRRILAEGGDTFATIFDNLQAMHRSSHPFNVKVRVNFDRENLDEIPVLMDSIREKMEHDSRYEMSFHRIGQWGGPNDDNLPVCDHKQAYDLFEMAKDKGFSLGFLNHLLQPRGSVCYAANPFSFVFGSDGTVYKCTVALDDERNKVGKLHRNGFLELDDDKYTLWVTSGEEVDSTCQSCFYRPSCQGNACPLERIQNDVRPCPPQKQNIKKVLQVIAE